MSSKNESGIESYILEAINRRGPVPVGGALGRSQQDRTNGGINGNRSEWFRDEKVQPLTDNAKDAPAPKTIERTALDGKTVKLPATEDGEPPVGIYDIAERNANAAHLNALINHAVIPPPGYHGDINKLRNSSLLSKEEKSIAESASKVQDFYKYRRDARIEELLKFSNPGQFSPPSRN